MNSKIDKATTYLVIEYDKQGEVIREKAYPMHLYTFDDVIKKLEGKEASYDIYESRYNKRRNSYVSVGGRWYEWDGFVWVSHR